MDRFGTTKLFIAVLLGSMCHCWDVNVEKSVSAIRGTCVLVPCSTVSYSKVVWYMYKSMSYPVVYSNVSNEIMSEFKGRTSLPGSSYTGDCSLRIDNVQYQDSTLDMYVWVWRNDNDHKGFYDKLIRINVLEPETPNMTVDSRQVAGKDFTATCTVRYSCPSSPPQIDWLGLTSVSNKMTNTKDGEGLWVSKTTATLKVTHKDQGIQLSCRSRLNGQYYQSSSVALDISYAPTDVKVIYKGTSSVVERNKISLECTSDSKPTPTRYEWLVTNNSTTTRYSGSTLILQNVMRDTSVSCITTNTIGRGESKPLALNVHYAPTDVKVIYKGTSSVVESNKISLECTSDSKPTPTRYEWFVTNNSTTTRYSGSTLILQNVMRDTSVSCITTNTIGRGESKPLALNVHYSPSILLGAFCSTQNGILKCVCQAEAKPNALITWIIDGIHARSPHFNTTTQHNGSVTVSELTGPYSYSVNCTATNSQGTDFTQIPLQNIHSKGLTSSVPVVAGTAVVCITLVVAVCVTAIVVLKKRRQTEPHQDLPVAVQMNPDKVCSDSNSYSDEDLYVNTVDQDVYQNQETNDDIYANCS